MNAAASHHKQLRVDGMNCAHCARAVEKSLKAVQGISGASANFAAGTVNIEFSGMLPAWEALEPAVTRAGYTLVREEEKRDPAQHARNEERRNLWLLLLGVVLVTPVLVTHFAHLHGAGWDWMNLALAVVIQATVGLDFYKGAIAGIRTRNLGMDVLVSIGMAAGLGYGVALVLFDIALPQGIDKHVYFEAATLLVVFLRLGKYVEARARGNALTALRSLLELAPEKARVRRGEVIEVPAAEVKLGEVCIVSPGGRIPVDGEVVTGESDVDEAMLTGEPVPVARRTGDVVRAGTIATNGNLEVRATAVGSGTALAHIVRLVEEAQGTKAPIQRFADRVSNVFVPVVVTIALVSLGVWLAIGADFSRAATHAIAVLVIACPCALGIAVPAAVMIGSGAALRRNILVKNGAALERISRAAVFAFDKTGTLTQGKPAVQEIAIAESALATDVHAALAVAAGASTHPFTQAVATWMQTHASSPEQLAPATGQRQTKEHAGLGLIVEHDGRTYIFGAAALLAERAIAVPESLAAQAQAMRARGESVSLLAVDGRVLAAIGFADAIRDDAADVIARLKASGVRTVLITGDHEAAARRVADALGLDEVFAAQSPAAKLERIDALKARGVVAMVGDGINDAPALARADVGVAIGGGSDVAKETGDIVLVSGRLGDLPLAIELGRRSLRAIRQNLFLSLCYNAIGIPLAAGVLVSAGIFLPPSYAALAMVLSDLSVAGNSARLAAELRRVKRA
ncbi:MAG: heavy metal translocating P-type ATPase [Planctomycetes bacterium]|nr:heavy metal translocating P-type ATPase [Planctomycetota bacterium]MCW8136978.1 heavy metal translocating P-type ATPase [Planctomycetota bacterium]